ncbi:hypothetical protein L332_03490 [Agrococcus pavilionensis RW1]|uniref:Uncharacterized protein n=1 Tax=Agrococcus pavilionensis RW1 TaxID=1330458 RepID=U1LNH5_9MICO|nr:hypothetical protein [Agrococcus pavilionensis]ERG63517.1 hypothetical protein L332_03490 [Agrococcus pavilionensis RW1]
MTPEERAELRKRAEWVVEHSADPVNDRMPVSPLVVLALLDLAGTGRVESPQTAPYWEPPETPESQIDAYADVMSSRTEPDEQRAAREAARTDRTYWCCSGSPERGHSMMCVQREGY